MTVDADLILTSVTIGLISWNLVKTIALNVHVAVLEQKLTDHLAAHGTRSDDG